MKRHHWQLLALLLTLVLAVFAAGCGGDDEETRGSGNDGRGGDDGRERVRHRLRDGRLDRPRAGIVPGCPGRVRGGEPRRDGQLHVGRRPAADAALDRGRGRQPARRRGAAAAGPDARLRREGRPEAARLRRARTSRRTSASRRSTSAASTTPSMASSSRRPTSRPSGTTSPPSRTPAWKRPATWDDFLTAAETIGASGLPAYSIGGADGWTLTDLFENIYLRTAGPEKYDQLSTHEIPWTDQSVKDALTEMAKIVGDTDNIVGGTSGALQTDFPTSVSNVFAATAKGAQVIEGDFVPGVVDHGLEPETDFNVFAFPPIGESGNVVVGGGDTVVMFEDTPAAQALITYLTTSRGGGDLGRAGRVRDAEQGNRHERLSRPDHRDDRRRARRSGGLPLRPLRPAARCVRRHGRPGPVQAVPGLRREPGQHRRNHAANGDGRSGGVRLAI